jgi:hypothetical protein
MAQQVGWDLIDWFADVLAKVDEHHPGAVLVSAAAGLEVRVPGGDIVEVVDTYKPKKEAG